MDILMLLRNSSRRYGIISIGLHWIFALAVYAMFGLGLWMVTLSYYDGWYQEVMTEKIPLSDGMVSLPERPGLGTALRPEVLQRPDAHMEYSDEHHRIDMSKG